METFITIIISFILGIIIDRIIIKLYENYLFKNELKENNKIIYDLLKADYKDFTFNSRVDNTVRIHYKENNLEYIYVLLDLDNYTNSSILDNTDNLLVFNYEESYKHIKKLHDILVKLFLTEINDVIRIENRLYSSNIVNYDIELSDDEYEDDEFLERMDVPENTLNIDEILDKLSKNGKESLTQEEKDFLEKYN